MTHASTKRSPLRALLTAARHWLAISALGLAASSAQAVPCPGDVPNSVNECIEYVVYRLQTWPGYLEDAAGRRSDSQAEANAFDAKESASMLKEFKGKPGDQTLAIRSVVRVLSTINSDYCNCNFELNGAACRGDNVDRSQCVRTCRYERQRGQAEVCTWAARVVRNSGGHWYSFSASTEFGPGKRWARNYPRVNPLNADWSQSPPIIKRAKCLSDLLNAQENLDFDALFTAQGGPGTCPNVSQQELQAEATPR
ncbi:MAG: hypothetical protein A2711_17415 [Burkholderiales bacterium RIFCSPHIGHO2_01_FULL_63_240]|jgi:hypothetical protein|nr:MAG: hypothetical protein A2711_17415 [Burkholderiales bacterium RIFCSPHIGHO2_01_FULL_63_240]